MATDDDASPSQRSLRFSEQELILSDVTRLTGPGSLPFPVSNHTLIPLWSCVI